MTSQQPDPPSLATDGPRTPPVNTDAYDADLMFAVVHTIVCLAAVHAPNPPPTALQAAIDLVADLPFLEATDRPGLGRRRSRFFQMARHLPFSMPGSWCPVPGAGPAG